MSGGAYRHGEKTSPPFAAIPEGARVRRCPACAFSATPSERAGWLRTERDGLRCDRCWARFEADSPPEDAH